VNTSNNLNTNILSTSNTLANFILSNNNLSTSNTLASYIVNTSNNLNTNILSTSNTLANFILSNNNILSTSNSLASYIVNTSNNIINIIIQNYCKKTTFSFITSTPYIYNGITYYTYNIQLNKFINFLQLNSSITLAKFRIHTAPFDSSFNDTTIRECEYLIMISNISTGLNVRAIGLPQDIYLQNIQPWKVVKSYTMNYITYISPVQDMNILCTMIDEG
jgi:hypothetical protein